MASPQLIPVPAGCTVEEAGKGGATCVRPVESNVGVADRDRAAHEALEGDDRQTDTRSIHYMKSSLTMNWRSVIRADCSIT